MKIQSSKNSQNIVCVQIEGDVDFHSSPELRRELARYVDEQAPKLMINLKGVDYIDSSGLATFVELFQKLKRYGAKLVLFNLSSGVRGVFEIAKLDTIFRLAADEKEALALVG